MSNDIQTIQKNIRDATLATICLGVSGIIAILALSLFQAPSFLSIGACEVIALVNFTVATFIMYERIDLRLRLEALQFVQGC